MSVSLTSVVRWGRIIGLIGLIVLLGACSAVKIGYNNVPELAYWWLDAYADFNDVQTAKVRDELARLHQWHRATELPKVADLLQKMQRLAPRDITPEQVCSLFTDVRNRLEAVNTQAEPGLVALAMSLTPEQLTHVEGKFSKNNADWRQEWLVGALAERQARRLKSSVERAEQIYSTLEEEQLAVLRASIASSSFDPELSLAERLRRQQDLIQTLRQISTGKSSPARASLALRGYLERALNSPNPAYRSYSEKSLQDSCQTFALLHNSTTTEQRARAAKRLAAYERDFRELAAQR